ncbi:hypothetical protein [Microbispora sp. H13382]|uniref:hypothetical protein n=1 Tax=Microbispora sp. H13382 TaxID=2729112 RepID=UPI0015FFD469|nr:hypothetical protein [Microbispora sp. H13382]
MHALLTRVSTICAAITLASAVTAAPAAAQGTATYTCTSGNRNFISDLAGYFIIATGCTGPSTTGTVGGGTIAIPSGTYGCRTVNFRPEIMDLLTAQGC